MSIGFNFTFNYSNNLTVKFGTILANGFIWFFEDTDFRIFSSENGVIHSWASVDLKPTTLFRVMFKVSHSNDRASTQIVDVQTTQGNWIRNPQVTNEDIDYRLQLSYAL